MYHFSNQLHKEEIPLKLASPPAIKFKVIDCKNKYLFAYHELLPYANVLQKINALERTKVY